MRGRRPVGERTGLFHVSCEPPATVGEALAWAAARLARKGVSSPRVDARVLLCHATGLSAAALLAHPERALTASGRDRFRAMVARREQREPVPYITGEAEFCSRAFTVTPEVLIPRPETELVVEEAIARLAAAFPGEGLEVADLGTGSGVLAVTLALAFPGARMHAVDVSAAALDVARLNAGRHGVAERIAFYQGDFWEPLAQAGLQGRLHAAVSNPPYVAEPDMAALAPEVREYEPPVALSSGPDGLACLRRVVAGAPGFLCPRGILVLEVGAGQAGAVLGLLAETRAFVAIGTRRDYAGHERVVYGVRGSDQEL